MSADDRILRAVKHYWGFDALRPLQREAIDASLSARDSLVVMPTGGGKSLCYQVPPLLAKRLDIVVSPLISLMKDQVDALRSMGYPAAALHSGLDAGERRDIEAGLSRGEFRLLFVAPERLLAPHFIDLVQRMNVRSFAIDEAHCISQWGHDFRPEYRQLATLREHFPGASVHAFTATATPRVRDDIAHQLSLRDPLVLVGVFDRPNLVYRILPQVDLHRQCVEVIRRHKGEAVIVYCLSRNDTEEMAATLSANGIQARHYHAGLGADERRATQDAFAAEQLEVVVATVAFGMGIDRSNVRCVLHATMPKTVEHYQQETGRAGRDGLEAECVMLYSPGDVMRWERLIEFSAEKAHEPEPVIAAQKQLLRRMQRLCSAPVCRHKALSEYFGQPYEKRDCGACDVCLGEVEGITDGTVVAQKILSCVARTEQRFGIGHVVDVLKGVDGQRITQLGHDQLSTYGLLKDMPKKRLTNFVYQLIDQDVLGRTEGDRPVLHLNEASLEVLRGQRSVSLQQPAEKGSKKARVEEDAWEGVDRGLFEHLRGMRRDMAAERGVPAFTVFDDNTLRDLARIRPTRTSIMRRVRGIGEQRLKDLGPALGQAIRDYCDLHELDTDVSSAAEFVAPARVRTRGTRPNPQKDQAMAMFRDGRGIDELAQATGRTVNTVAQYLEEFIGQASPESVEPWVDRGTYAKVAEAAGGLEVRQLRPIHDRLNGAVPYEQIRVVLAHLRTRAGAGR